MSPFLSMVCSFFALLTCAAACWQNESEACRAINSVIFVAFSAISWTFFLSQNRHLSYSLAAGVLPHSSNLKLCQTMRLVFCLQSEFCSHAGRHAWLNNGRLVLISSPMHEIKFKFWTETPQRRPAYFPATYRIYSKKLWSLRMMNRFPWKYGHSIDTGQATARHSLRVLLYNRSVFVRDHDLYPTDFVVLSGYSNIRTYLIWIVQAAVHSVKKPFTYFDTSTGGEKSWSWSFFIAVAYSVVSSPKALTSSVCILCFLGAAMCAKFETDRLIKFQIPGRDYFSVKFVGGFNPLITPVLWEAICNLLNCKTWPR